MLQSLSDGVKYDDLVSIEKDNQGNITLLATDAQKVNYINREIAVSTQDLIEVECDRGVGVPFGAFTGVSLVGGLGFKVNLHILNAQSVYCDFVSEFNSVGINQTRHAIYIEVVSTVNIVLPALVKKVEVVTEVLICDAVIVGKIPEVYLGDSLFN